MATHQCASCAKQFDSTDAVAMHTQVKHAAPQRNPLLSPKGRQKMRNWMIGIAAAIVLIGLPLYLAINRETLPPTSMEGHIEANPHAPVLREPMPIKMQQHMLEHADGSGSPGVIINYNCKDYACEPGLIEKLEVWVEKYPAIYVAPFPRMDAKIALTRLQHIQVLEEYDEEKIEAFIRSR